MANKRKNTKIIYRALGKERANGIAHIGANLIEIDHRLTGRKHIEILIHEKLHLLNPEWSETKIIQHSKELTRFLWDNGIRWVDL